MVVLTKKKKKTPNAAYHSTKKIFWGSLPTSEARCSLKSAVWRRIEWVHQSANDKTTTWPPAAGSAWKSCFDKLDLPWQTIGARSSIIIQRCAACPWNSAIFPGGRHYFSPHKMAKKNHWLSWHSRFNGTVQPELIRRSSSCVGCCARAKDRAVTLLVNRLCFSPTHLSSSHILFSRQKKKIIETTFHKMHLDGPKSKALHYPTYLRHHYRLKPNFETWRAIFKRFFLSESLSKIKNFWHIFGKFVSL